MLGCLLFLGISRPEASHGPDRNLAQPKAASFVNAKQSETGVQGYDRQNGNMPAEFTMSDNVVSRLAVLSRAGACDYIHAFVREAWPICSLKQTTFCREVEGST